MNDQGPHLRLIRLMIVVVWVAVAFAVMTPVPATIFALVGLVGCLVVGLRHAPVTELLLMLAFIFTFGWFVSNAVEQAKPTVKTRATQRTVPIPAK